MIKEKSIQVGDVFAYVGTNPDPFLPPNPIAKLIIKTAKNEKGILWAQFKIVVWNNGEVKQFHAPSSSYWHSKSSPYLSLLLDHKKVAHLESKHPILVAAQKTP